MERRPGHRRRRTTRPPSSPRRAAGPVGALFLLGAGLSLSGGGGDVVVRAMPENNGGGGGRRNANNPNSGRGSATLRDSFPCESDGSPAAASNPAADRGTDEASTPASTDYLSGNSFAAMNDLEPSKTSPSSSDSSTATPGTNSSSTKPSSPSSSSSAPLSTPRGGTIIDAVPSGALDDDELDRMVDSLIAGLDDDDEGEEEEEETEVEEEEGEEEEEAEEDDEESDVEDLDEEREEENEEFVEEPSSSKVVPKRFDPAPVHANSQQPDGPSVVPGRSSSSRLLAMPQGTPTNAYYRFLVRRGPKGHALAAFSLVSIQWVYLYLPLVYKSLATILLKLRIYDPKILYEKDRQRETRRRLGPPPKKKGLTSKLFGTSGKKAQAAAMQQRLAQKQKMDDVEAATKLKQLYKTMKAGTASLSEVKYRYLSVAFRKKHRLGNEYKVVKPRTFMGEVVEDGRENFVREEADTEVVFSEGEEEEEEEDENRAIGVSKKTATEDGGRVGSTRGPKRRPKRKRIEDWVVRAFASSPKRNGKSNGGSSSSESLWTTVERTAILDAALEGREAEKAVALSKGRRGRGAAKGGAGSGGIRKREGDSDESDGDAATATGSGSTYGASKMFQSMMTRVGTNGRIFGAYPNDAPPIQLCSNKEGVIGLARRYGYGDWRRVGRQDEQSLQEEASDDGDESWGGGDLFDESDEVDGSGKEDLIPASSQTSGKRRSGGGEGKRKRRRKRKKTSLK